MRSPKQSMSSLSSFTVCTFTKFDRMRACQDHVLPETRISGPEYLPTRACRCRREDRATAVDSQAEIPRRDVLSVRDEIMVCCPKMMRHSLSNWTGMLVASVRRSGPSGVGLFLGLLGRLEVLIVERIVLVVEEFALEELLLGHDGCW